MRNGNRVRTTRTAMAGGLVLSLCLVTGTATANPAQGSAGPAVADTAGLASRYADQTLRINVWLDKAADEVYAKGEAIEIDFQTNEDAYVVVYEIDVEGRVQVLWPVSRFNDGFVFGHHEYRLPASGGPRLRTAAMEGVGYVNALASRYPFDLRDLDVDFHHEQEDVARDFYVAGDPFLAMNEVNLAVTGLEDPSEFVVSNYASYYVHRPVDHPRYLCSQCHIDDDVANEPYASACTVTIRHDYDWVNVWWDRYGYYPVYYYPVYYYVDPWGGTAWVHYWYRPWYYWPAGGFYHWDDVCYDWRYSPYWRGDCHDIAHGHGDRRYRPLDKPGERRGGEDGRGGPRVKSPRVTDGRPDDDRLAAMRTKTLSPTAGRDRLRGESGAPVAAGGERVGNVAPTTRAQSKFTPRNDDGDRRAGLRVPRSRDAGRVRGIDDATRPAAKDPSPSGRSTGGAERPVDREGRGDEGRIKPVEPRGGANPTWSGRRSGTPRESEPARPAERPTDGDHRRKVDKPTPRVTSPAQPRPESPQPAPRGDSGGRRIESKSPRANTPAPAPAPAPAPPARSDGGKGGDRGGSSGGRGKSAESGRR